jgi:hypothetical protein
MRQEKGAVMKKAMFCPIVLLSIGIFLLGCEGDRGPAGPQGETGTSLAINTVSANPFRVGPSDTTIITASVTHAGDDTLTYSWTAESGEIIGSGSIVRWEAPEVAGDYVISVTVSDSEYSAVGHVSVAVRMTSQITLLEDRFTDPPLNTCDWIEGAHHDGDAFIDSGRLVISSGETTPAGGGTWVLSTLECVPELCGVVALVCTTQVEASDTADYDDSFWGFYCMDGQAQRVVAFRVAPGFFQTNSLYAMVRNGEVTHSVELSGVDYTETHVYCVQVQLGRADFYVDNRLAASIQSSDVPSERALRVRFDKTSPGWDTALYVEGMLLVGGGLGPP